MKQQICVVDVSEPVFNVDYPATRELQDAINNLLEYWDHGTPVHASSIVVADFRAALANARKDI